MKTVLVLEDEPVVMKLLRGILASRGYAVLEAATAEEALGLYESSRRIDLLLADVVLPVSSGIYVAFQLKAWIPALRIILTSGCPPDLWNEQHKAELSEIPSDSVRVLLKPFLAAVLLAKVAKLIGPPENTTASAAPLA